MFGLWTDLIVGMDEVSSHVDSPVFYYEVKDSPGVCVDRGDGSFVWSPIKINKTAVKVGEVDSNEDDLNPSECLMLDYQPREEVPVFEVETRDKLFWALFVSFTCCTNK